MAGEAGEPGIERHADFADEIAVAGRFHAGDQGEAGDAEDEIGQPGREFWRDGVRPRGGVGEAGVGEVVAEEGEQDSPDVASAAA